MTIYQMDDDTYDTLSAMQRRLHNMQRPMTFGEQRDFAERWRLFMARIYKMEEETPMLVSRRPYNDIP